MSSNATPYTPEVISELRALVKDLPSWLDARDVLEGRLGITPDNITRLNRRFGIWNGGKGVEVWNGGDRVIATKTLSDSFETTVETSKAATLEEVIAMCKVDSSEWESKGFSVRRGSKGFAWNARFAKRTDEVSVERAAKAFLEAVEGHEPREWGVSKAVPSKADCLYVLNIQDLHLSKLSWRRESGADYDINIAKQVYRDAVEDLMHKVPHHRIEEILMIGGSDFLQTDTDESTTAAGTYVDSDGRLAKAFGEGCALLTDVAEVLAEKFKVKIIVIPGNHDEQTSHFMGCYLSAWFRNHPNVIVDNEPRSRKYHAYGKVLLGLVHGHKEKLQNLPLIMMRENQGIISNFKYQEWLTGHRHVEMTEEMQGIKVRTCNALCAPDQWHFAQGYVGTLRTSQGLLYNKEHGLEAIFYSKPID